MPKDWIKAKQAELLTQAQDFSEKITLTPVAFGLAAPDAVALASDVSLYETSYQAATDPATKTEVTVEQKNFAKDALIARMRSYGRRISANPAVTDAQKISLGLNIRDTNPSKTPAPGTRPVATVILVNGRTVRVRIADELTPNQRAKPDGVSEYELFTFVGESAPAEITAWTYQGQGTRNTVDITLPPTTASGAKVWIACRWCNRRGVPGPTSAPVAAIIVGSIAEAG